jgi:uncharacterized membrane protein YoaK (UPF0700 family)
MLYEDENKLGVILVSYSMGLQNALFTNFSGAVVRTTHVTGLLTDIGIHFGHWIRHRQKTKEFWRVQVLLPIFIGFVSGGIIGTWLYDSFAMKSMYFPAAVLFIAGAIWTAWRLKYQKNMAKAIAAHFL